MDYAAVSHLPPRVKDISGHRAGRLTVIRFEEMRRPNGAYWRVQCDCGNIKVIHGKSIGKPTVSCGCWSRERASEFCKGANHKHGLSRTRIDHIYRNMMEHCLNLLAIIEKRLLLNGHRIGPHHPRSRRNHPRFSVREATAHNLSHGFAGVNLPLAPDVAQLPDCRRSGS